MKEFFCKFNDFFHGRPKKQQGSRQNAQKTGRQGGGALRKEAAGAAQHQQIEQPAQQHPQQHEQAQAAPAGDAAQEIEQHRRQKGIGKIKEDLQLFQPETAQEGRQELIEKAQGPAAGQAHQGLKALIAGIDAHQPRSFPRKPRRCSRSCA